MKDRPSPTRRAQRAPSISWPNACRPFLRSRKMPRKVPRRGLPRRGLSHQRPRARMPSQKPRPQKPPPAASRLPRGHRLGMEQRVAMLGNFPPSRKMLRKVTRRGRSRHRAQARMPHPKPRPHKPPPAAARPLLAEACGGAALGVASELVLDGATVPGVLPFSAFSGLGGNFLASLHVAPSPGGVRGVGETLLAEASGDAAFGLASEPVVVGATVPGAA